MPASPKVTPAKGDRRQLSFLAKSQSVNWQVWKETEPQLRWLLERQFQASDVRIRLAGDQYLVEIELPEEHSKRLETSIKDGQMAIEIDKIHGLDPALYSRRDVKISKYVESLAPERPVNPKAEGTILALEERLAQLELEERARSVDLRVIMTKLQTFQVDSFKRLESLDKRVDDLILKLDARCERMEKVVARFTKP
ncbi:hypothetical protein BJ742DRAFT_716155 [Cladochytrium replicatum]|nr:hypothetical protein BJ742DRAFT_716155 [Cladochytrium replicatum]